MRSFTGSCDGRASCYNRRHMAEKIIGSLIYGQHEPPKKRRPLKERLKVPLAIVTVLVIIGGVAWKFANYREERQVSRFLDAIRTRNYETAYKLWDADERYQMKDFLADWGDKGYYTASMRQAEIIDSNTAGGVVIVYAQIDNGAPLALRVDKETLKLSYSPVSKYPR